jgi:hypothetical protein
VSSAAFKEWVAKARAAVRLEDELERRGIKNLTRDTRFERSGPCPRCGGSDRFAINTKKQAWNCRNCRCGGGIVELVEHLDGVDFLDACRFLTGCDPQKGEGERAPSGTPAAAPSQPTISPNTECPADDNYARALSLWREAKPLGDMARQYFANRGIHDLSALPDLNGVLRFHPTCPFGQGERHPCIVALLRNVVTNKPQAIHRIALTRDAGKFDRKALGPKAGAAAKLWPDETVSLGLVVGEGIETVLAAALRIEQRGRLLRPAWSMVDAPNLAKLPVLAGIESLTVLVDNDPNFAGALAARECTRRWFAARREVIELTPKEIGTDFNDIVRLAS